MTRSHQQWPEYSGSGQIYTLELRKDISWCSFPCLLPKSATRAKKLQCCLRPVYWAISKLSGLACSLPWRTERPSYPELRENANTTSWCRPVTNPGGCSLRKHVLQWSCQRPVPADQHPVTASFLTEQTLIQLLGYTLVENSTEEAPRE